MLRVLIPGHEAQIMRFAPDASVGAAIRAAGGDPHIVGMEVTVDGRRASPDSPVGAATTVALQPKAANG